jgi:nicotinamidase-related amidase
MPLMRPDSAVVALIDVQENHFKTTFDGPETLSRTLRFLKASRVLGVPILWTEQVPRAFGPTLGPLRELLEGQAPIAKSSFGCFGEPAFEAAFQALGRRSLYLVGSETHICVGQTALQALERGLDVVLVADCVNARGRLDHTLALDRLARDGVLIATWETVLYEWMRDSRHPSFKAVLPFVKG